MIQGLSERIENVSESWRHFLRGLWFSGLRLREALTLSWDEYADGLQVDMSEKYVALRIPGEHEKGGKDRAYPASPEFAELLRSTPEDQRQGFVFNPIPSRSLKGNARAGADLCGRIVARFGEAADVVVDKKGDDVTYASSHDLRRSFGLRWSRRVMPPVLQELMRHESIDTTMKYYVGQDAQSTAAELYAALESAPKPQHLPQPSVASGQS
jgi:integrase